MSLIFKTLLSYQNCGLTFPQDKAHGLSNNQAVTILLPCQKFIEYSSQKTNKDQLTIGIFLSSCGKHNHIDCFFSNNTVNTNYMPVYKI